MCRNIQYISILSKPELIHYISLISSFILKKQHFLTNPYPLL